MPLSPVRTPTNCVALDQQFRAGEARKNIDAAFLNLLAKPADELVQRNNVVAVVLQRRWNDGQPNFRLLVRKRT